MHTRYAIVRFYQSAEIRRRIIAKGLTLDAAQAHCENPDASSSTCTTAVGNRRTREIGSWFDGYTENY